MKLPVERIIDAICSQYIRERERVPRDLVENDPRLGSLRGGTTPESRFDEIEVHES